MDGLKHFGIILVSLSICIGCATDILGNGESSENVSALDSTGPGDAALESDLKQTEAKPAPPPADRTRGPLARRRPSPSARGCD